MRNVIVFMKKIWLILSIALEQTISYITNNTISEFWLQWLEEVFYYFLLFLLLWLGFYFVIGCENNY